MANNNKTSYLFTHRCQGVHLSGASQVALVVNNLPANAGDAKDVGLILGQEDSLKKEIATYSSILAWRVPWTEETGRL